MRLTLILVTVFGVASCGGSSDLGKVVEVARSGTSIKVRQDACGQIAEVGGSEAVDALVGFLDDEVLWYCAAHGLGELRDPRAVEPLLERAQRGGDHAFKMVWALGEIRDPRVLSDLQEMSRSLYSSTEKDQRLRESLEEAIAKLTPANSASRMNERPSPSKRLTEQAGT